MASAPYAQAPTDSDTRRLRLHGGILAGAACLRARGFARCSGWEAAGGGVRARSRGEGAPHRLLCGCAESDQNAAGQPPALEPPAAGSGTGGRAAKGAADGSELPPAASDPCSHCATHSLAAYSRTGCGIFAVAGEYLIPRVFVLNQMMLSREAGQLAPHNHALARSHLLLRVAGLRRKHHVLVVDLSPRPRDSRLGKD